jgi:hypothetical protein
VAALNLVEESVSQGFQALTMGWRGRLEHGRACVRMLEDAGRV